MFAMACEKTISAGKQGIRNLSLLALLTSLLLAGQAAAQNYQTIPFKPSEKAAKVIQKKVVTPSLRDASVFNQNKSKIDAYFQQFYFPRMTSTDKVSLGRLSKQKDDLFKLFIRRTSIKEVQQHLTSITMGQMVKMALGNFHPAVRYNAVLIIGMLDETSAVGGANPQPPVPLPAGTKALLILLEKEVVKDVKIPISLKLGALKGLQRHARFGINAKYADKLTQALLKLMAQEEPPEDVTLDVFHWIQCQAAHVLVQQTAKTPNAKVQAALTAMIANDKISLEDRCCVAGLLQEIQYSGATDIQANATRLALGTLTNAVFKAEATFAKDFQEELKVGGNFGARGGRGGFGGGGGRGVVGPQFERRRIMARLKGIADGGRSLGDALQGEEKQQLKELITHIDSLMAKGGEKDSVDLDVAIRVLEEVAAVNRLIQSWKVADEPAAEEPADDDFS